MLHNSFINVNILDTISDFGQKMQSKHITKVSHLFHSKAMQVHLNRHLSTILIKIPKLLSQHALFSRKLDKSIHLPIHARIPRSEPDLLLENVRLQKQFTQQMKTIEN